MDEDIEIINTNTRNQKIKNFFVNNKKKIIIFASVFILIAIFYFLFLEIKERNKIKLAEKYNKIKIEYKINNKEDTKSKLIEIVYENDTTYSPLALYFMIDNEILTQNDEINMEPSMSKILATEINIKIHDFAFNILSKKVTIIDDSQDGFSKRIWSQRSWC